MNNIFSKNSYIFGLITGLLLCYVYLQVEILQSVNIKNEISYQRIKDQFSLKPSNNRTLNINE